MSIATDDFVSITRPIEDIDLFNGADWKRVDILLTNAEALRFSVTFKLNFPAGNNTAYVAKSDFAAIQNLFANFQQEKLIPIPKRERASRSKSKLAIIAQFFDAGEDILVGSVSAGQKSDRTFIAAFRAGFRSAEITIANTEDRKIRAVAILDASPKGRHTLGFAKKDLHLAEEVFRRFGSGRPLKITQLKGQRTLNQQ